MQSKCCCCQCAQSIPETVTLPGVIFLVLKLRALWNGRNIQETCVLSSTTHCVQVLYIVYMGILPNITYRGTCSSVCVYTYAHLCLTFPTALNNCFMANLNLALLNYQNLPVPLEAFFCRSSCIFLKSFKSQWEWG